MPKSVTSDTLTVDAGSEQRRAAATASTLVPIFRVDRIVDEPPVELGADELVVGRAAAEGPFRLADDPLASRKHARFHARGAEPPTVVDLESHNGVFINGRRVAEAELADGDLVRVGSTLFVFRRRQPTQLDYPVPSLVGGSPAIQTLRLAIGRVAARPDHVLIQGPTGTGKELVAQAIHDASGRKGRFVAVNCTSLSENLAESQLFGHVAGAFTGAVKPHDGHIRAAEGGTLLLDEVGDMDKRVQPKLLRALEQHEVHPVGATTAVRFDARVLAATHVDLADAVRRGDFRADLFARLAQLTLRVPALAERREDILAILARRIGERRIAADLAERMVAHDWPLNVRELAALAVNLLTWGQEAPILSLEHAQGRLPDPAGATPEPGDVAGQHGEEPGADASADRAAPPDVAELKALLDRHGGNIAAVARAVGRSRTQIYRWMQKLGLDDPGG